MFSIYLDLNTRMLYDISCFWHEPIDMILVNFTRATLQSKQKTVGFCLFVCLFKVVLSDIIGKK